MLNFNFFSQRKISKIFWAVLCVNLVAAGIYSLIFIKIEQKTQASAELSTKIADLTLQKDTLQSIKKNISETSDLRNKIDSYFVSKDGMVDFLNLINDLGAENNLTSKVISVGIEPASMSPDTLEVIRANVQVYGTWADVYHFSTLLELLPLKISVNRFNLEKFSDNNSGSTQNQKNASVSLRPWTGSFDIAVLKLK